MTTFTRTGNRAANQLRPVRITRHYTMHAEGSVLIEFGNTKVLCTASVEERVPPHKRGSGEGWVTAEYGMLPRATHTRSDREAARGKQTGRTHEIQRLIGRSLRAVLALKLLGARTIQLACAVLPADGGPRRSSPRSCRCRSPRLPHIPGPAAACPARCRPRSRPRAAAGATG